MAELNKTFIDKIGKSLPTSEIGDGKLNPNTIGPNIFNKITTQRIIRTFEFSDKFYARYAKRSSMYGDLSEVTSFGLGRIEDGKDSAGEGIKDKAYVQAYSNIVRFNMDKQYAYTLSDNQMQLGFKTAQSFGNAVSEIRNSIEQQKQNFGYNTIVDTYKESYKNIIEIDITNAKDDKEKNKIITNKILETIKAFTLPSDKFNVVPDEKRLKMNAVPITKQIFTGNLKNQVDYETSITQNFNMGDIPSVRKLLGSDFAEFNDDSIIGVLDTDETIYIGLKQAYGNFQQFAKDRYTNFYYNELHECGVIGYVNGVVFKLKGAESKKK